jgi:hypothetical protein
MTFPRHPSTTRALALALMAALAGCESVPKNAVTKCQQTKVVPSATDILFVIDDSGSMQREQDELKTSFDAFIARLANSPAKDFQIGVTNTSVDWPLFTDASKTATTVRTAYEAGTPSAGVPYPAGALIAMDASTAGKIQYDAAAKRFTGTRILGATSPTLVADFKANAGVGTSGAGKEQGLRAMQLALTERVADGTNAGFLRSGARLAVVIVTDEDDCSDPASPPAIVYPATGDACHSDAEQAKLPAVSDFVNALQGPIAGEKRDVVVALIAGVDPRTGQPVQPVCNTAGYPAKRYLALTGAFGAEAVADDVCLADFSATLERIANLIAQQVTLSDAPTDASLLAVSVARAAGSPTTCTVAEAGSAGAADADAVFAPASGSHPATVSFQKRCALQTGDEVQVKILCAG